VGRWFGANCHWLEVHQLPACSPELNPTERLWQYTRQKGTHNRYFANQAELASTLTRVFTEMPSYPELIHSYLVPFFLTLCPLIYARLYGARSAHSDFETCSSLILRLLRLSMAGHRPFHVAHKHASRRVSAC
jgi:hypothetical protein